MGEDVEVRGPQKLLGKRGQSGQDRCHLFRPEGQGAELRHGVTVKLQMGLGEQAATKAFGAFSAQRHIYLPTVFQAFPLPSPTPSVAILCPSPYQGLGPGSCLRLSSIPTPSAGPRLAHLVLLTQLSCHRLREAFPDPSPHLLALTTGPAVSLADTRVLTVWPCSPGCPWHPAEGQHMRALTKT